MPTPTVHAGLPQRKGRAVPAGPSAQSMPAPAGSPTKLAVATVEPARRHTMISEAAYFLAEHRGFGPGHELEDWLTAECEIDDRSTSHATLQSLFARKLRERWLQLRSAIRDALLRADAEQYASIAGEVHDVEDDALADLLVDVNLAEITRDVEELRDTESALRRVAMGTFGVCVVCKEPIARERLEAYPTAKRCLPCQRRHEQARATAPPPSL